MLRQLRHAVETAVHRAGRAQHDPGERGGVGPDFDEADAGVQLHRPSGLRDDRPGVRHRRWLWQWAAGSGVDAAPYFRIFNPMTQVKKFDADLIYIRKWVPEFESIRYQPMVDHKFARERCLSTYKQALNS